MIGRILQNHIWELPILGATLYEILSWFFIFSFFGWVWETSLVSIRSHKLVNRGFVVGPVCTIYGAGAVSVYLILEPLKDHYFLIFLVGILVATLLEYVTSAIMEKLFHSKWWDYSNHPFNLKGRICLGVSVGWGFMSLALFLIFMPAADWIMSLYPPIIGELAICLFILLYVIDFSFAAVAAFNLEMHLKELQSVLEELREKQLGLHISEKLEEAKKEFIKGQDMISKRFMNSYPLLSESLLLKWEEFEKKKEALKSKLDRTKK